MDIVKHLGFILLAVYLIIIGIVGLAGIVVSAGFLNVLNILALVAGVFILFHIGKCCSKCSCEKKVDFHEEKK